MVGMTDSADILELIQERLGMDVQLDHQLIKNMRLTLWELKRLGRQTEEVITN